MAAHTVEHTVERARVTPAQATPRTRLAELDWLRAIVVLGLIPFHTAVIFASAPVLFLRNAQTTPVLDAAAAFVLVWGMPMLFLIAGAGAWFALQYRSPKWFLGERAARLFVPFIFATLTIIPVQVYVVVLNDPRLLRTYPVLSDGVQSTGSFIQFYPQYLQAYGRFLTHYAPDLAMVFFGHLWFIPRLLAFCVLALPLLLWLRRERGQRFLAWLGRWAGRPGALLLFGLPLGLSELALRAGWLDQFTKDWPLYDVWAEFALFLLFFVYGYVIYASPELRRAIARDGPVALVLAVGALAATVTLGTQNLVPAPGATVGYAAYCLLRGFLPWLWVFAVLSFAMRYLRGSNKILSYLTEATFPLYVLHLPLLSIVGFYVIRWDASIAVKYFAIVIATTAATLALYELVVRRSGPFRVLFGLKPRASRGSTRREVSYVRHDA